MTHDAEFSGAAVLAAHRGERLMPRCPRCGHSLLSECRPNDVIHVECMDCDFAQDIHPVDVAPDRPVSKAASLCRVAECDRLVKTRGLCNAHYTRWFNQGKPDLEDFIATTPLVQPLGRNIDHPRARKRVTTELQPAADVKPPAADELEQLRQENARLRGILEQIVGGIERATAFLATDEHR